MIFPALETFNSFSYLTAIIYWQPRGPHTTVVVQPLYNIVQA